ncbi:MAG: TIGR03435 family protein [Bryobacteraceae bacterium]
MIRRRHIPWLAIVGTASLAGLAQTPAGSPALPRFEVASIKAASPSAPRGGRLAAPPINTKPGLLTARNATLKQLIRGAYALENYQISGGPGWADSAGFDVDAKSTDGAGRDQLLLMLQALLADRFQLRFHHQKKELAGYDLVVGKGGPKFHVLKPGGDSGPGKTDHMRLKNLASLATYLTRLSSDQPVIDKTGLTGQFDIDLDISKIAQEAAPGEQTADPIATRERMFQATANALPDELGLKLVPARAPVEIFVIDHVEKAGAN